MTTFSVRVPDDLARRFDQAAAPLGGRSARLRQLIMEAAKGPFMDRPPSPEWRSGARIMVRLAEPDAAGVDAEAARLGLRRAAWVAALVRRRVRGKPTFSQADEMAVLAIQTELRRIGINVNQIARALNTAVLDGRALELELAAVRDFRVEIRGHLGALRQAFEGNLAYWRVEP